MSRPNALDLRGLIALIEERAGVLVPDRDRARVDELVRSRLAALRLRGMSEYLQLLRSPASAAEWRELLSRLTIKESSLFRAPQHFRALAERVIPELQTVRPGRRLRFWSAGCARGEEAATLAAVLADLPGLGGWDWRVLATDVDESALEVARTGAFGRRATERAPDGCLQRHFERVGERWVLRRELLERIDFRELNLIDSPFDLPDAPFDVVLLRNVLIYFREEAQERVVQAVVEQLASDGFLFLGPTESLLRLQTVLEAVDLGDCFAYRVRRTEPSPAEPLTRPGRDGGGGAAGADPAGPRRDSAEQCREAPRETGDGGAATTAGFAATGRPHDPGATVALGLGLERAGETDAAIRAYRAALYLDPDLVQVRCLLAECLQRRGWAARARSELRQVLATLRSGSARAVAGAEGLGLPEVEGLADRCRRALERGGAVESERSDAGE